MLGSSWYIKHILHGLPTLILGVELHEKGSFRSHREQRGRLLKTRSTRLHCFVFFCTLITQYVSVTWWPGDYPLTSAVYTFTTHSASRRSWLCLFSTLLYHLHPHTLFCSPKIVADSRLMFIHLNIYKCEEAIFAMTSPKMKSFNALHSTLQFPEFKLHCKPVVLRVGLCGASWGLEFM